jgi:hypothetical protein
MVTGALRLRAREVTLKLGDEQLQEIKIGSTTSVNRSVRSIGESRIAFSKWGLL